MSSTRVSATAEDEKRDKRSQKRIDKCVETLLSESRDKFDRARLTQVCRMYAETVEDNKKLTASNHQLQQRIDSLLKEKSSLESENSKSLLARTRLEGLCRQLQKQNKQVKEEHTARLRGEEERRREAAGKFQTTLSEITSLMTNNEKRYAWLTEDNRVMSDKLKELLSKYDDNNSAVELLIKQKDLEYQLAESRLVKLQQEAAKEKKDMLLEKHTMLTELNQCQARCLQLHEQLKLYSENYDRAQSNMSQSDKMISNFKSDMNKMQKNVKRMEKETSVWRGRCEVTGNKLASLSSTNSDLQHRLTVSDRKVATLEKLCRALHSLKLPAVVTMSETADSVTATSEVEVSKSPVKAASNGQEDSTPATETATKNGHMSAEERDKKILRQVEYYFGNYNLPKDKFLTDEMKKDDGWVPMSVMLKFKRLAALSDVEEVIAAALKNSSLLQLSEDGTKIRRSPECPLPPVGDDWKERLMERTLYIKGLPIEFDLDATLSFFNEFEDFENVQRRNWLDKKSSEWRFKGSVYVTFKSREKAQQVLDNLPVKYKDEDLEVKWQAEHIEEKQAERGSKRNQKADKSESKEVEEVEGAEVSAETEKTEAPKYLLGTVLHMKGFKEDVNWPDIKDALNVFQVGRVAYVDFSNGDVEGYARFFEEDAARRVFEKLETPGRLKVGENMVDVRVVEGEEETKYMDAQMEARSKRPPGKKRKYHTGRDRGGHMPKRGRV